MMSTSASHQQRLLKQSSHYSLANLGVMLSGLVSFPIITRVFSVRDYGTMNLIAATLSVAVAVGKFGIQHSVVPFNSEITAGKSRFTLHQLYSTTVLGLFGMGVVAMLVLVIGSQLLLPLLKVPSRFCGLLTFASLIVLVEVTEAAFVNLLRAEHETAVLMTYQLAKKYLGLALILTAILVISSTLKAFYAATLIAEATALGALAAFMFRHHRRPWPRRDQFSVPLFRHLLDFGLPMMVGYELSGLALAVGDRYVIGALVGETPLGLYSAAYNLCQYVQGAVMKSISMAIVPLYVRIWDREGADATAAFLGRSLRVYAIIGAALTAGLAAVGPELLPALASEKYEGGASIIPWVIAGMVIDGATMIVGAGVYVQRKTKIVMVVIPACALLNVALNIVLIPRWNILGSAVATLVSYTATACIMGFASRRLLRVQVPWATLLRASLAAAVMYWLVVEIDMGQRWATMSLRTVLGAAVYAGLMLLVDSQARVLARHGYESLRDRATKGRS